MSGLILMATFWTLLLARALSSMRSSSSHDSTLMHSMPFLTAKSISSIDFPETGVNWIKEWSINNFINYHIRWIWFLRDQCQLTDIWISLHRKRHQTRSRDARRCPEEPDLDWPQVLIQFVSQSLQSIIIISYFDGIAEHEVLQILEWTQINVVVVNQTIHVIHI